RVDPNPDFIRPQLFRISAFELPEDRFHLVLRLPERDARLEPSQHSVIVPLIRADRIDAHRRQHIDTTVAVAEILRQHADDRIRIVVDRNALAGDGRIGAESPLPQPVAQDHDALAVRRIFLLRETAPDGRIHAQYAEEIRGDSDATDELRLTATRQIDAGADAYRGGDAVERLTMLPPEDELGFAGVPETHVRPIRREPHNPLGLRVGKRAQEHGIHDGEDRRVSSDTQSQRNDGD